MKQLLEPHRWRTQAHLREISDLIWKRVRTPRILDDPILEFEENVTYAIEELIEEETKPRETPP